MRSAVCAVVVEIIAAGLALQSVPVCVRAAPGIADSDRAATETLKLERGELSVLIRDNSQSPRILSGLDSLFNLRAAPEFDAFDPDSLGASAGLNFEHVISGHANPANSFTPRRGRYELQRLSDDASTVLVRRGEDDPWKLSSNFKYTLRAPNHIDFEFQGWAHDAALFGKRGYAVLFFANYMNDVEEVPIYFRGVESAVADEKWIRADAPPGHPDYNTGGTYRSAPASDLQYDADHNFKLNLWSYDYPRFTQPFYYGRAKHGMVLILMFDRMHSAADEIRFSLFKFKIPRHPRPAWDFQYVIHRVEPEKPFGFKGRLIWKKFVSQDDCVEEYTRWKASLNSGVPGNERR